MGSGHRISRQIYQTWEKKSREENTSANRANNRTKRMVVQKEDIQILCVAQQQQQQKNNTLNNTEINVNEYALGFVWQTEIKNEREW